MQGNDTLMIAVTAKVKAFTGKLGLWVRNLEGKSLNMFSCLKGYGQENGVETSYTVIDRCIKNHLVNLQSRFSKCFQKQ
jgi:hypothetical protein